VIRVRIVDVRYVNDIQVTPNELEEIAGSMSKPFVIGLVVKLFGKESVNSLIEVSVSKSEQLRYFRIGGDIAVEQKRERYVVSRDWEESQFFQREDAAPKVVEELMPSEVKTHFPKPNPRWG